MELKPRNLHCNERKPGISWFEAITKYVEDTTSLIQRKAGEDDLPDMQQELAVAYGSGITYLYGTRKHRDEALGNAFLEFPKGKVLSEEQIALARARASTQIRLHELIKDALEAIKLRIQVNRQHLNMRQMER